MKIGIVGLGVVGQACQYGFEKLGHSVLVHDIKLKTDIYSLKETDIIFVCVPTPQKENGECDISVVKSVVSDIIFMSYGGVIAIKSTVSPGTTSFLIDLYRNHQICFVPEFLRERCAIADFTENHDLLAVGCTNDKVFSTVKEAHGSYPKTCVKLLPTEAELLKYLNNIHNATLITLANSFYEVSKAVGVDYSKVKAALVQRQHVFDRYLDCNEAFRGFGGVCLPKDLAAIAALCKEKGLDVDFFQDILKENAKYKKTVFPGMRLE